MTSFFRPLLFASTTAAVLAAPALAQERRDSVPLDVIGTFGELFEQLQLFSAQVAIVSARFGADIRYDTLDLAPDGGSVVVTGLEVALPLPGVEDRSCFVSADTLEYSGSTLSLISGLFGSTLDATNLAVSNGCLPPDAELFLGLAQLDEILFEDLSIVSDYNIPSARGEASLRISMRDIADIEMRTVADYLFARVERWGPNEFGEEPGLVPSIEFGPTDITIRDRGVSERIVPFLGMTGVPAEAAPAVVGDAIATNLGLPDLGADLEREVGRFLSEGGRITIALRPDELWLDEIEGLSPPEVAQAFNPTVGSNTRPDLPSADLLEAVSSDNPTDEQRVAIARASLSGDGFPRNPSLALSTLEPILDANDEAKALTAEALLETRTGVDDTLRAYELALEVGAAGEDVGTLLRRAEARLTDELSPLLGRQNNALDAWGAANDLDARVSAAIEGGDTETLIDLARQFERGRGAPRNWQAALTYASLAEAAGEIGARSVIERVEAVLAPDGEPSGEARTVIRDARDRATELWTGGLAQALIARAEGSEANGASDDPSDAGDALDTNDAIPQPEVPSVPAE